LIIYYLDENGEIQKGDSLDCNAFLETEKNRKICQDLVDGKIRISTVFLMVDHNYTDNGPPILFETMIFGGYFDGYQQRYYTKKEAVDGHAFCLSEVNLSLRLEAMIKIESLYGHEFQKWKMDHLLENIYFFECGNYIGFDRKEDAAVFMLSHWYNPPKDID